MKTKEAIERVRSRFDKWALDEEDLEALRALGLVTIESEDERIRKEMIDYFSQFKEDGIRGVDITPWIAYLEKQKDSDKAQFAVELIDKYISEHTANAHDMDDSNPDKKYYSGVDDTLSNIAGILISAYSEEKQKEQKPAEWSEDERIRKSLVEYFGKFKPKDMWDEMFSFGDVLAYLEKQKEMKPALAEIGISREDVVFPFNATVKSNGKNVTIIHGQLGMEAKQWIRFCSDKNDNFRVYNPEELQIQRKEQKPAEWSEEDKMKIVELKTFIAQCNGFNKENRKKALDMIDALRPQPHWKPSEEQMEYLAKAIETLGYEGYCKTAMYLSEIRKELKKL